LFFIINVFLFLLERKIITIYSYFREIVKQKNIFFRRVITRNLKSNFVLKYRQNRAFSGGDEAYAGAPCVVHYIMLKKHIP